jgi:ribosomal protein L11 methyltransferase
VPAFEAALQTVCATVGLFRDEATDTWRVEGVREAGAGDDELAGALALASAAAGIEAPALHAAPVEAEGWLARTVESFPEQPIGRRFLVRPTHLPDPKTHGRLVLRLDAGLAFGSGEHASTRGCLLALERIAHRRPRRVLDLGTGSGILALAAAKLLRPPGAGHRHRAVVRARGRENARLNRMQAVGVGAAGGRLAAPGGARRALRPRLRQHPRPPALRHGARPRAHLAPGGTAILAGLLGTQARMVLAAHRRRGLVLERRHDVGPWTTLVLRRRG